MARTALEIYQAGKRAVEAGDMDAARKLKRMHQEAVKREAAERSVAGEAAYAGGAGVVRGAAENASVGSRILDFMQFGIPAYIAENVLGAENVEVPESDPGALRRVASDVTGGYSEYESPRFAGQVAGTGGEFVGGALTMPIGGPVRAASQAIVPGIASELAGQAAAAYAPEYENMARLVGALGAPFATEGLKAGARRALTGGEARLGRVGSERARSIQALEAANVPLTAGQKYGSTSLMRLEGVEATDIETMEGISKQVMRLMGSDAPKATRSAMLERKQALGDVFERAEAVAGDIPTAQDVADMARVAQRFQDASGDAMPRIVKQALERIDEAVNTGTPLSGQMLSDFRTRLSDVIETTLGDERAVAAMGAKEVIDNIIERSVKRQDPDLFRELVTAREQYRAFLTGMRALNRQGTDIRGGIISPAALSSAARIREGTKYLTGTGSPLGEFAFAAEEIASSLPAVMAGGARTVQGMGGFGGAVLGAEAFSTPLAAALGGLAGVALPRVAQSVVRSGPVQRGLMPPEQVLSTRLIERLARQPGGLLASD